MIPFLWCYKWYTVFSPLFSVSVDRASTLKNLQMLLHWYAPLCMCNLTWVLICCLWVARIVGLVWTLLIFYFFYFLLLQHALLSSFLSSLYPHTTNSHGRCCPWLRTVFCGSFSVKKRVLPPHSCQVLAFRGYFDCWGCVSDIVGFYLTLKRREWCCENWFKTKFPSGLISNQPHVKVEYILFQGTVTKHEDMKKINK